MSVSTGSFATDATIRHCLATGEDIPLLTMETCVRNYYGDPKSYATEDRVESLIMVDSQELVPEGGEKRGDAIRRGGLRAVLDSPNMYPVGANSMEARLCLTSFDRQIAEAGSIFTGVRVRFAKYYHKVVHNQPSSQVVDHPILGCRKKIEDSFANDHNNIVALLLLRFCFTAKKASKLGRLYELGAQPDSSLNYQMLLIPILMHVVTEMNPYNSLSVRVILNKNLSRLEYNIRQKPLLSSIWSQDRAVQRIGFVPTLGVPSPSTKGEGPINMLDQDMCSGTEFKFARMYSLIVQDFKWKFDRQTQQPVLPWITAEEKALMYRAFDDEVVPLFDRPRYGP